MLPELTWCFNGCWCVWLSARGARRTAAAPAAAAPAAAASSSSSRASRRSRLGLGGGSGQGQGRQRVFDGAAHAEYRAAMAWVGGRMRENEFLEAESAAREEAHADKELSYAVAESNREVTGVQDYEFLASEARDREKATQQRLEQARAAEAETMAAALALSATSAEEEASAREARERSEVSQLVPPEPPKGADNSVTICFRLPPTVKGGRFERRFYASNSARDIQNFVLSRGVFQLPPAAPWTRLSPLNLYLIFVARPFERRVP